MCAPMIACCDVACPPRQSRKLPVSACFCLLLPASASVMCALLFARAMRGTSGIECRCHSGEEIFGRRDRHCRKESSLAQATRRMPGRRLYCVLVIMTLRWSRTDVRAIPRHHCRYCCCQVCLPAVPSVCCCLIVHLVAVAVVGCPLVMLPCVQFGEAYLDYVS